MKHIFWLNHECVAPLVNGQGKYGMEGALTVTIGIKAGHTFEETSITDIAPTMCALLGTAFPTFAVPAFLATLVYSLEEPSLTKAIVSAVLFLIRVWEVSNLIES